MSEYHVIEIAVSDQSILVATLVEMGYKPNVYDEAKGTAIIPSSFNAFINTCKNGI